MSCFLPYSHSNTKIEPELDLSNLQQNQNQNTQQMSIHQNMLRT